MLLGAKSAAVDWLVVGLGNPGAKYEHTRHNMGFLTVDLLAEQAGVKLNKVKFKSAYNIIPFAGAKCLVMKPQTYMNLSGEAVREAVQFYKIPADHVLVIYDDVSLPVGKLRVRPTGSWGPRTSPGSRSAPARRTKGATGSTGSSACPPRRSGRCWWRASAGPSTRRNVSLNMAVRRP